MIQRIQTLFLLAVSILQFVLFFTPYWAAHNMLGINISLDAAGINGANVNTFKNIILGNATYSIIVTILNIVLIFLALATIFIYNNRPQQIRLCRMGMLLCFVLFVMMVLSADHVRKIVQPMHFITKITAGIGIPFLSLILLFFAARRIRHDENLVRSADRLR
ncbi:MAG: DUF4293 family protein [Sphingobacteriales bacterium]|nr:MAG: DUF4293 family protein [Sphingobacteriales bacterium]